MTSTICSTLGTSSSNPKGKVVCHEIPKWILEELGQAERRPTDRDKLRLLLIHEKGEDLGKALVVTRLGQFGD